MVFGLAQGLRARFEERASRRKDASSPSEAAPTLSAAAMVMKPTPAVGKRMRILQESDIQFFMTHGYVKIPACFSKDQGEHLMGNLWQRMGVSPEKSTWHTERIDLPGSRNISIRDFAPKAWAAICDLLGGEKRLARGSDYWDDSFIVNLGTSAGAGKHIEPNGWHIDGNFFAHFLDSPEQALLVLPLFTDVKSGGGGTMLCPGALPLIANFLHEHPEGL